MSDHILNDTYWNVLLAVMDADYETDHFRSDSAGAVPNLDYSSLIAWSQRLDFLNDALIDVWAFF
jgi:hypothetical protein